MGGGETNVIYRVILSKVVTRIVLSQPNCYQF